MSSASTKNKLMIGTAQFGLPYGIANNNKQVDKIEVDRILNLAFKEGINGIDTAASYGTSENIIGRYLKEHNYQNWYIVTKLNGSISQLYDQLSYSIDKLSTKPNAVLAHSAADYIDSKFYDLFLKLRTTFNIDQIGVSVYTKKQIECILERQIPDIIQCPLNILDTRLFRCGIFSRLKEENVSIHIRSVFLQGMFYLSDKIINTNFPDVFPTINKLRIIAQNNELTLAELSLLWVCSLEQIDKVILGVNTMSQLKSHINTLKKNIHKTVYKEALSYNYENTNVLDPSNWTDKN